jgi:hypothetical protein
LDQVIEDGEAVLANLILLLVQMRPAHASSQKENAAQTCVKNAVQGIY